MTVATGGGTYERPASGYARAWPALTAPLRTRTGTAGDGIACPPLVLNVNHAGDDGRPYPAHTAPLAPRTTRIGDGMVAAPFQVHCYDYQGGDQRRIKPITDPLGTVVANGRHLAVALPEPFVTMLRGANRPVGVDEPLATLTTGRNHAVTVPPGAFVVKNHGGLDYGPIGHMCKPVDDPLATVVTHPNLSLVVPYRRGRTRSTAEPLHTLATKESLALCSVEVDIEDCHFRMLQPREHLRGQRFPDTYQVTGNKDEQTAQAGNAVSANVAQWLGQQVAHVLGGDR